MLRVIHSVGNLVLSNSELRLTGLVVAAAAWLRTRRDTAPLSRIRLPSVSREWLQQQQRQAERT
jgi:hypothetical protein